MDLNKMLTYKAALEKLLNNDFDYYSLNLINDSLLLLSYNEYKNRLVTSLNKLIDQVNLSINDIPNKALLNHSIDELINQNRDIKEFTVTIFNSGILNLINIELLPKGYSLNKENIIIDLNGNLIFNDETILNYVKREYLPFIAVFKEIIELTNFSLLGIKDQVKRNEAAAVRSKPNTELSDLTAFELALLHWYIVKADIKEYLYPVQVGEKYAEYRNSKNIEQAYRNIDAKPQKRKPKPKELENVKNALFKYPIAQNSVINDLGI